jgi:hypothetical protein
MRFEDDLTDCGDYLEKAESGLDNLYNKIMRHLSDLTAGKDEDNQKKDASL